MNTKSMIGWGKVTFVKAVRFVAPYLTERGPAESGERAR
jgi:hypothetical protein